MHSHYCIVCSCSLLKYSYFLFYYTTLPFVCQLFCQKIIIIKNFCMKKFYHFSFFSLYIQILVLNIYEVFALGVQHERAI